MGNFRLGKFLTKKGLGKLFFCTIVLNSGGPLEADDADVHGSNEVGGTCPAGLTGTFFSVEVAYKVTHPRHMLSKRERHNGQILEKTEENSGQKFNAAISSNAKNDAVISIGSAIFDFKKKRDVHFSHQKMRWIEQKIKTFFET